MALDSVTSSGREPSMSLMDGSAPEFSRSSTMSANSHADATKGREIYKRGVKWKGGIKKYESKIKHLGQLSAGQAQTGSSMATWTTIDGLS